MLHVAPERCLEARLRQALGSNYLTADLQSTKATMQMDVTDIPFADAHFDVIYCSHVLEHVQDDLTAMTEFCRTLKPDGWAVLLVPITTEKTYEDPKITSAAERLKAYGHEEHVRRYGLDYVDRLRDAGFRVSTFTVADVANEREAMEMGLTSASGDIFFCTK